MTKSGAALNLPGKSPGQNRPDQGAATQGGAVENRENLQVVDTYRHLIAHRSVYSLEYEHDQRHQD